MNHHVAQSTRLKVLFVVEGFTDIRFVQGLSEISELSMVVPGTHFRESELGARISASRVPVTVDMLEGGRLRYQLQSFRYVRSNGGRFDVILSQELLRGSLSACLAARKWNTPVVTYTCLPALGYFRCRRERGQIGLLKSFLGETAIRFMMKINGRLAAGCVALGPYLLRLASEYCSRTHAGLYYGVDTNVFRVADTDRQHLRRALGLPENKFIIFLSSRISHEKDTETVLRATALARARGLDAVLLNLGGGYKEFLELARNVNGPEHAGFVIGRPAAHPMHDLCHYYQASDCSALASLSEGLGMSPLESMACGTPAICTSVGGLAENLVGYARLTPRRDAEAMAKEFLWVAANPIEARDQALLGREFVIREWSSAKAFSDLAGILAAVRR